MRAEELIFEYNIPIGTTFSVTLKKSCKVCQYRNILKDTAPYFYSSIPDKLLIEHINNTYGLLFTAEELMKHAKHVKPVSSAEALKKAKDEMGVIDAEIIRKVRDENVIDGTINSLHARRIKLETTGEFGKEYISVVMALQKWTELKLKKDKKIEDTPKFIMNFGDLLKIPEEMDGESHAKNGSESDSSEIGVNVRTTAKNIP